MDVSSKISAAVSHLAAVSGVKDTTQQAGRVESPPPPEAPEGGAGAQLSRPAQLINKLSQLRDSAPEQFKQAVSSIASELRSVSEQDSGMGAKLLVDLANKLDRAANAPEGSEAQSNAGPGLGPAHETTTAGVTDGDDARRPANRAAVEAYRATAEAHANGPAGRAAFTRAIESVDAAASGAAPRRH